MYKKAILKNNLRIITVPQASTRAVTVLVLVGTGSKYETKETNGISHFLEHMYFKGTKKRPSYLAVAESLDRIGGIYNAFTSEECTGYWAKVSSSQFDLALNWVSDIFLNSLLPNQEVKKERGVIIEEINMYYDHPINYVQILWPQLLYGDQPAGWSIAGTKENIAIISRQNLLNYMKNQYVASNTIICIAGKISEKEVIKKTKKAFSKVNKSGFKKKVPVVEKQNKPQSLLHFRKTDQSHICLGVRGYNLFHPQRYTQEVLGVILGGMMSSRLFIEVREKLSLAYYVKTEVETNPDTGYLVTQAGVDNNRVERAISAILKEYKKIAQTKISKEELKKAKENIKGRLALTLEASDVRASFYAIQELLERKIITPKELFKKIDKVSQNDILKVAKDIFQPKKLNLVSIGPFKDKSKINKLLRL